MDYEKRLEALEKERKELISDEKLWEKIADENKNMKRFNEGKYNNYAPCTERVKSFFKVFPNGAIRRTVHKAKDSKTILIEARVYALSDDYRTLLANGFAEEEKSNKGVDEKSYLENAETSAVSRALKHCGFGLQKSYNAVKIFDNEYIQVEQRIQEFRSKHPLGRIVSSIVSDKPTTVGEKAQHLVITSSKVFINPFVTNEEFFVSEGSALEDRNEKTKNGKDTVNTKNCIENAETSSIGRALGFGGFAIGDYIASSEEVEIKGVSQEDDGTLNSVKEKETIGEEGEEKILNFLKEIKQDQHSESYLSFLGKKSFKELTKQEAETFLAQIAKDKKKKQNKDSKN